MHCTLCLGSNTDAERHVEEARALLTALLPDVRWAEARWTEPVDFPNPALFLNQMASFDTTMSLEKLHHSFKEIERKCGRSPQDKAQGIVRMDIDLLTYGEQVIKVCPATL